MSPTLYPSLMLVLDSEHARWFRVEENLFTEITGLRDHEDKHSQEERKGDLGNTHDAENMRRHLNNVVATTTELWHKHGFKHLFCVEPDRYKNVLNAEIEKALPGIDLRVISGNHSHDNASHLQQLFRSHQSEL